MSADGEARHRSGPGGGGPRLRRPPEVAEERAWLRHLLVPAAIVLVGLGLTLGQGAGEAAAPQQEEDVPEAVVTVGQALFEERCATCHGADGAGRVGPALTNVARIALEAEVLTQVLRGSMYMPSFASRLDDEQIASVVTYVRNSFGNAFGLTTPEEVAEQR